MNITTALSSQSASFGTSRTLSVTVSAEETDEVTKYAWVKTDLKTSWNPLTNTVSLVDSGSTTLDTLSVDFADTVGSAITQVDGFNGTSVTTTGEDGVTVTTVPVTLNGYNTYTLTASSYSGAATTAATLSATVNSSTLAEWSRLGGCR